MLKKMYIVLRIMKQSVLLSFFINILSLNISLDLICNNVYIKKTLDLNKAKSYENKININEKI